MTMPTSTDQGSESNRPDTADAGLTPSVPNLMPSSEAEQAGSAGDQPTADNSVPETSTETNDQNDQTPQTTAADQSIPVTLPTATSD